MVPSTHPVNPENPVKKQFRGKCICSRDFNSPKQKAVSGRIRLEKVYDDSVKTRLPYAGTTRIRF
jgi:hypothetical protein